MIKRNIFCSFTIQLPEQKKKTEKNRRRQNSAQNTVPRVFTYQRFENLRKLTSKLKSTDVQNFPK